MSLIRDVFLSTPNSYTLTETLVFGLLFVGAVWFTYEHVLKRLGVRMDQNFIKALVPFIVLGALTRNLADVVLIRGLSEKLLYAFLTPGVYVLMFAVGLLALYASVKQKKRPYWKTMQAIGAALILLDLAIIVPYVTNWSGMAVVAGVWAGWTLALSLVPRNYLAKENYYILLGHMLDASATYTALKFHTGLFEEHWLARSLISGFGLDPAVMFALKLAVVWPVLYYIDKDVKDREYRTWLKLVVLMLGLALGIRDAFTIGMLGTPMF